MRTDGAIVELKVDKNSVAEYSPDCNDVSTEDEESPSAGSVTWQRLLETGTD
jgi:hypothetical protein